MFYTSRKDLERIAKAGVVTHDGYLRMNGNFWLGVEADDKAFTPGASQIGTWEAWVTVAIARELHERRWTGRFIDIGANVGYYSMMAAAAGYEVLAFEPNRKLARMVEDSALFNNFDNLIDVREIAIGAKREKGSLLVPEGHSGGATLDHGEAGGELVVVDTLDNVLTWEEGFESYIIKVDVEGYERNAWDGAKRFREETNNTWFVEFVPERHGQDYNREWLDEVQLTHDIFLVNYEGGLDKIDTDLALKRDFDTLAFRSR